MAVRASEPLNVGTLIATAAQAGVVLESSTAERLLRYADTLLKWNAVHNLTAIERPEDVLPLHLLDSLAIIPPLLEQLGAGSATRPLRLLDVGSGGGLPGLPLAVALPAWQITVLDKVRKKTAFLQHAKADLRLGNVTVVHARVEDWRAPAFDCIVSRAFSSLHDFTALTAHLLAPAGRWLAMKGAVPHDELRGLPAGVTHEATVKLRVPLLDAERHLLFLRHSAAA